MQVKEAEARLFTSPFEKNIYANENAMRKAEIKNALK